MGNTLELPVLPDDVASLGCEELGKRIAKEFPDLVIELSGPWPKEMNWIANFKSTSITLRYVHPGSSGADMIGALREGYRFLLLRKAGGSPYGV